MDKKKIIIAAVAVVVVIAIAIIVSLLPKDTNTVYTISFNTDGGNKVVSQKIEEGEKVTKPADPSKEGYEFLGWYLNGEYFDFETEVKENLTLDAKWKEIVVDNEKNDDKVDEENKDDQKEENKESEEDEKETTKVTKYTVTFESNGGNKVASKTVEKNKTVKAPTDPTREGYIFKGWYLGSTKYNFSKKVTKNITLTAHWEKIEQEKPNTQPEEVKEYTVKFESDGGSEVKSQTVKEGEKVGKPINPTRDGYIFKGWYLDGKEFDFSTKISKDITLKAKWEQIKQEEVKEYTITFKTDGGSEVKSQTVKENGTASKPSDPKKDGHKFIGWYHNGTLYNFNTKVTGNVTLIAKWEKNSIITHKIESIASSYVGEVYVFVIKDDVKVDGIVDITWHDGTVTPNVSIPKNGLKTNGYDLKSVTNVRVK